MKWVREHTVEMRPRFCPVWVGSRHFCFCSSRGRSVLFGGHSGRAVSGSCLSDVVRSERIRIWRVWQCCKSSPSLKEFNQSWAFAGLLWFCGLSVRGVFSLGWFWRYLVLATTPLVACIAAWHECLHLAGYNSKANPLSSTVLSGIPSLASLPPEGFTDSSHLLPGFSPSCWLPIFLLHSDLIPPRGEKTRNLSLRPMQSSFPILT